MEDRGDHIRREKKLIGGKARKSDLELIRKKILEKLREDGEDDDDDDEEIDTEENENAIHSKEFISLNSGDGGKREDGGGKRDEITSKKEEIGRKETGGRRETWRSEAEEGLERKVTSQTQIEELRSRQRVSFFGSGIGTKTFDNGMTMGTDRKLRPSTSKINYSLKEEFFIS